jgi:hypothetical protein
LRGLEHKIIEHGEARQEAEASRRSSDPIEALGDQLALLHRLADHVHADVGPYIELVEQLGRPHPDVRHEVAHPYWWVIPPGELVDVFSEAAEPQLDD